MYVWKSVQVDSISVHHAPSGAFITVATTLHVMMDLNTYEGYAGR